MANLFQTKDCKSKSYSWVRSLEIVNIDMHTIQRELGKNRPWNNLCGKSQLEVLLVFAVVTYENTKIPNNNIVAKVQRDNR